MEKDQEKKLKELLRGEFLPLFVGLRTELKSLGEQLEKLIGKAPPEVQKTEITNLPENIKEITVSNLPEIQKTEITNFPEPVKEVEIKNLSGIHTALDGLKFIWEMGVGSIIKGFKDLREAVFKVNVENQIEFPKSIRVENLNEIAKAEPTVIPTQFKISNSQPDEAVPVILTTADRKSFYNAIQQVLAGNDVDLSGVKSRLDDVVTAIENIEVTATIGEADIQIGAVEIKDHDSSTRLDVELDSTKNAAFVQSESFAQEDTLILVKSNLQSFIDEFSRPATSSVTSVAGSVSTVTILASNTGRKGFAIYNDSTSNLFIKFGSGASLSSFTVKLGKNDFYEMNERVYTGIITGVWSAATGDARITELTS